MPIKFTAKEHKFEAKEKLEKEHKEHKDKPEKIEIKERKDVHKDFAKYEIPEYLPQPVEIPDPAAQARTEELSSASASPKLPEKLFKAEYEKVHKVEKHEKHEYFDKFHKDKPEITEYYVQQPLQIDPAGPVEQRLAALEAAMAQLVHFIPQEQRPDLSKGALKQEPEEEKKS